MAASGGGPDASPGSGFQALNGSGLAPVYEVVPGVQSRKRQLHRGFAGSPQIECDPRLSEDVAHRIEKRPLPASLVGQMSP
jgi:hypothetical protein